MTTSFCRCCTKEQKHRPNFTWKEYFWEEKFELECYHCGRTFRRSKFQKVCTTTVTVLGFAAMLKAVTVIDIPHYLKGIFLPIMCILVNLIRVVIVRWTPWEEIKKGQNNLSNTVQ